MVVVMVLMGVVTLILCAAMACIVGAVCGFAVFPLVTKTLKMSAAKYMMME